MFRKGLTQLQRRIRRLLPDNLSQHLSHWCPDPARPGRRENASIPAGHPVPPACGAQR